MSYRCCVNGCSKTKISGAGNESDFRNFIRWYRLPKSRPLLRQWIKGIDRPETEIFTSSQLVCSDHFEDDDFVYRNLLQAEMLSPEALARHHIKLKDDAIPNIDRKTGYLREGPPKVEMALKRDQRSIIDCQKSETRKRFRKLDLKSLDDLIWENENVISGLPSMSDIQRKIKSTSTAELLAEKKTNYSNPNNESVADTSLPGFDKIDNIISENKAILSGSEAQIRNPKYRLTNANTDNSQEPLNVLQSKCMGSKGDSCIKVEREGTDSACVGNCQSRFNGDGQLKKGVSVNSNHGFGQIDNSGSLSNLMSEFDSIANKISSSYSERYHNDDSSSFASSEVNNPMQHSSEIHVKDEPTNYSLDQIDDGVKLEGTAELFFGYDDEIPTSSSVLPRHDSAQSNAALDSAQSTSSLNIKQELVEPSECFKDIDFTESNAALDSAQSTSSLNVKQELIEPSECFKNIDFIDSTAKLDSAQSTSSLNIKQELIEPSECFKDIDSVESNAKLDSAQSTSSLNLKQELTEMASECFKDIDFIESINKLISENEELVGRLPLKNADTAESYENIESTELQFNNSVKNEAFEPTQLIHGETSNSVGTDPSQVDTNIKENYNKLKMEIEKDDTIINISKLISENEAIIGCYQSSSQPLPTTTGTSSNLKSTLKPGKTSKIPEPSPKTVNLQSIDKLISENEVVVGVRGQPSEPSCVNETQPDVDSLACLEMLSPRVKNCQMQPTTLRNIEDIMSENEAIVGSLPRTKDVATHYPSVSVSDSKTASSSLVSSEKRRKVSVGDLIDELIFENDAILGSLPKSSGVSM